MKKGLMMKKQVRQYFKGFSLFVLIIILSLSFVLGAYLVRTSGRTAGELETVFNNVNRSVWQVYNITINNTYPSPSHPNSNITSLNVTLPVCFRWWNTATPKAPHGISDQVQNSTFQNTTYQFGWVNNSAGYGLIPPLGKNISFWFNASANCVGNQTIIITVGNGTQETNYSLYVFVRDLTNISYATPTPADYTNTTDTSIYINASLPKRDADKDGVSYRSKVVFWLTWSNGTSINKTSYLVNDTIYNSSYIINWSNLNNGTYRYNISVNDSYGNTTWTATRIFVIDNIDPVITFNCSSASVDQDTAITCQCTANDTDRAVHGTTPSYTPLPATDADGTFTTTCYAVDNLGNNATSSISYTVNPTGGDYASSSTSSGGSSTTAYTNTYAEDTKEFSEIKETTKQLKANEKVRILVDSTKHNIGVTSLTETTAKIEIFSTLQTTTLNIGDAKKFDLNNDDYYDLSVTLNKIEASKADITLKSVYEKIIAETAAPTEEAAAVEEQQPEGTVSEVKSSTITWVIVIIIVILVIIAIGYGIKRRR